MTDDIRAMVLAIAGQANALGRLVRVSFEIDDAIIAAMDGMTGAKKRSTVYSGRSGEEPYVIDVVTITVGHAEVRVQGTARHATEEEIALLSSEHAFKHDPQNWSAAVCP